MSYVVQVISHFRTYNVLLENGIPSVLELVQTAKPPVASMQSDRSVRTYSEMGAKVVRCIAHEEDLKREFLEMERVLAAIDPKYADLLVNFYCLGRSKSDSLKSGGTFIVMPLSMHKPSLQLITQPLILDRAISMPSAEISSVWMDYAFLSMMLKGCTPISRRE